MIYSLCSSSMATLADLQSVKWNLFFRVLLTCHFSFLPELLLPAVTLGFPLITFCRLPEVFPSTISCYVLSCRHFVEGWERRGVKHQEPDIICKKVGSECKIVVIPPHMVFRRSNKYGWRWFDFFSYIGYISRSLNPNVSFRKTHKRIWDEKSS